MLEDVEIDNIFTSKMLSSVENDYIYFIVYKDEDYKLKRLCIMLPKTRTYVKSYYGETSFGIKMAIFEKNIYIWNKVSNSIKKELDFKPIYNKFFFKKQNKVLQ